jgi:hypothetical protein
MANTPTPYMEDPVRLPCSRCCALDFLWLVDTWEPLCLVCAAASTRSRFLAELLTRRVATRASKRALAIEHRRTHPEDLPKAG